VVVFNTFTYAEGNQKYGTESRTPCYKSTTLSPHLMALSSQQVNTIGIPKGKVLKHLFQKVSPIRWKGKAGVSLFFMYFSLIPMSLKSLTQVSTTSWWQRSLHNSKIWEHFFGVMEQFYR
jgi:hypothetical protein